MADYIFLCGAGLRSSKQFVFQTLILHAPEDSGNISPRKTPRGVYLGHKHKWWDCYKKKNTELESRRKLPFLVRARVFVKTKKRGDF